MNNDEYIKKTNILYKKVMKAFEDIDPDRAEADFSLDNITITFFDNTKFIINRQPPVKQIWLATNKQGLHFDYYPEKSQWISDHGEHGDFFSILSENIKKIIGIKINF